MSDFECDVFISYKREERVRADHVAQKLKALGLRVWFDTRLKTGESFDEQIAGHLKVARIALVCWTPEAIASTWVRAEASMAHNAGKLVAVFLEPTDLIPPFNLIQTEDLSDWNGEDDHTGWTRLLTRIASMSGDQGLKDWAALMNDGNPAQLKAWASAQPAGPLRATTRFWISEVGGGAISNGGAAKRIAKVPRSRFSALAAGGWVAAGIAGILVGGLSLLAWNLKEVADKAQIDAVAKVRERQLTIDALQKGVRDLTANLQEWSLQFGKISALRDQANKLVEDIDEVLPRRPGASVRSDLSPPTWRQDAEEALGKYVAELQVELNRIDRTPGPRSFNHQNLQPTSPGQ